MHICYLGWANHIHMERWAKCFADRGHKVSILTNKENICHIDGVDVIPLRFSKGLRTKIWHMKWILKKIKPDILHAHYITAFGFLAFASGIRPVIQTAWGSDIYEFPYKETRINEKLKHVLHQSDIITCDSLDLKKHIIEIGGIEERIKIIQWGVDRSLFNHSVDFIEFKEKLGLSGKKIVFSPRHFAPIYNIDIIIRTIPKVIKEIPNAFFLLKNYNGALENELMLLAKDLGICQYIMFINKCSYEDMVRYYRISDLFISVPSSDGTPVSLLEAMACGVPPLVSDLPSIREWIIDNENGKVVSVRNVDALARGIIDLLSDEKKRLSMINKNYEIVASRGDHRKNMNIMEDIYLSSVSNEAV
jgi:L-malate glycosyltransferase